MTHSLEFRVIEMLIKVQDIIGEVPVHKEYRSKLSEAEQMLDEVLDILQPYRREVPEQVFINEDDTLVLSEATAIVEPPGECCGACEG